nr:hypothetical protein [Tanacetum cinerariifolium]
MRELIEDTFSRNNNDDAHEHVERILDIAGLFNIPGAPHDAVMLPVFHITLTRATKISKQWHEESNSRKVSSGSSDGILAITNKLDTLSLESKVKALTRGVEGGATRSKIGECKEIFTKDGSPIYTPFYYSPEEIEYFPANLRF